MTKRPGIFVYRDRFMGILHFDSLTLHMTVYQGDAKQFLLLYYVLTTIINSLYLFLSFFFSPCDIVI